MNIARHRKRITLTSILGVLVLTISLSVFFITNRQADGAPVVGFKAGRIIDDSIFTNKSSMSAASIQAFLNSKVPVCDTNGEKPSEFGGGTRAQWAASRGYSPPFTCLKDFSEGGRSAAQIIYDTAQTYSINPQVFIVLLQKEQGLILDDWPIPGSSQYRTATGYACPDTAPCDAQYYGLTKQLDWSGKMFRAILNNSPTWYTPYLLGENYIQYNPNAACGGSVVNIENRSTQALYNYTPYQPNPGALAAGWGQADCGAYGNRNFYLYYTNWFGPTNKPAIPACPTTTVDCVWEFVHQDTGKHFYTSSLSERNAVYLGAYNYVGVAFFSRKTAVDSSQLVSRLYNSAGSEHIWLVDGAEKTRLIGEGWVDEGQKFIMDPVYANTGAKVTRLYTTQNGGKRIFSTNGTTIKTLLASGYTKEATTFTSPTQSGSEPTPTANHINVYRFFTNEGRHFWTTNENERLKLLANPSVYQYEGVSWEADAFSDGLPVYRLYSPQGRHFWTTVEYEKNSLIDAGWRYEGIAWRESPTSTKDIHRFYNALSGTHLFTASSAERQSVTTAGWRYEGIPWKG